MYPDSETYFTTKVLFDDVVNLTFCSKFAFALHDQDVSDSGDLLKPHYHLVISAKYPVKFSDVLSRLDLPPSCMSLPEEKNSVRTFRSMVRYLIHADSPKKYQYDISSIHSNFDVSVYFDTAPDASSGAFLELLDFVSDKSHSRRSVALYAAQNGLLGYYRQYYRILWDIRDYEEFKAYIPAKEEDFIDQ